MKSCFCLLILSMLSIYPVEETFSNELTEYQTDNSNKIFSNIDYSDMVPSNPVDPDLAFALSILFPGLGSAYIGDYKTAGAIAGSTFGIVGAGLATEDDNAIDNTFIAASNIVTYGMYAAYRDARNINKNYGYKYSMPQESYAELSLAPFQWQVMKKPEVWGGILGALAVGSAVSYIIEGDQESTSMSSDDGLNGIYPLVAFSVGIGEEALFRGALLPMFSESFGPRGGLIVSSILFGAAHIPNAYLIEDKGARQRYLMFGVPFITAMGTYMGWISQNNNSLKECTALHSWYDFILFAASYSATNSVINQAPTFSISHRF